MEQETTEATEVFPNPSRENVAGDPLEPHPLDPHLLQPHLYEPQPGRATKAQGIVLNCIPLVEAAFFAAIGRGLLTCCHCGWGLRAGSVFTGLKSSAVFPDKLPPLQWWQAKINRTQH